MQSISNILGEKKHISSMWRGVDASLVVEFTNTVLENFFGAQVSNSAKAVYYKSSNLTIAALSSIAAQEIKFREKDIIMEINNKFGQNKVRKIKYLA